MPTLQTLEIENYRSICGPIQIEFPRGKPVVLIGENNAGKSNIVRALGLVLGPAYANNHDPEDHEFYCRDRGNPITIRAFFDPEDPLGGRYTEARWTFAVDQDSGPAHRVAPSRSAGRESDFMSGDAKDSCVAIVIEAERNLNYQLSYASKYTLLSKLMHKFHKELCGSEDTKADLERLFQDIRQRFEAIVPFAEFTRSLQTQLGDLVGNMTHRLEVDFQAYNPVNFFHALRLQAAEGTEARTLEELGTGEQQILALSFAYAYATAFHGGIILVIEEPEAHLHPLAQQWLARRVTDMCAGGLQVVLTTHSPHFIDVAKLDGLVLVRKAVAGTHVVQMDAAQLAEFCVKLGASPTRTRPETVLPHYHANVTTEILEGFFSKAVVLVEGPTEALALPILLEKCGLQLAREGIALVPVHGKGNLGKWRRLYHAYGIPTYLVFDNDAKDDKNGNGRRDALASMRIPEDRFDDVLASEDWVVTKRFALFGANYEHALRGHFPAYAELEAAAAADGVTSKPFIARWVAERLELNGDPGWEKLQRIRDRVRELVGAGSATADATPAGSEPRARAAAGGA